MTARTAGCRTFDVPDARSGRAIPVVVMYPGAGEERPSRLGPYTIDLAADAPVAPGTFPLVVLSHGTGGSPLVYRDTAAHLARNGFVVALPEHPGNNRSDDALAGTAANLEQRPRHVRLVVDWAFGDSPLASSLKPDAVAIAGHSMGGYTALAVAGGIPTSFPSESEDGQARRIDVTADARVKALVLFAPATPWFRDADALAGVRVPLLLFTGERDRHAPHWFAEIVEQGVRDRALVERVRVANAGHFAYLTPFPPEMTRPDFPPSQDPPGFDRVGFLETMNAAVVEFLSRAL